MGIKSRQHRIDVLQGTLDMLILQILQWGSLHGLAIAQTIRTKSEDLLKIEAGSLYPALHRLEQQGWLAAEWKTSEKGQRGQVLPINASRQEAAGYGAIELGTPVEGDSSRHATHRRIRVYATNFEPAEGAAMAASAGAGASR
jgi:PadR family transcriptional regulator